MPEQSSGPRTGVIVAAPDKFRGTATARQVAAAVAEAAAALGVQCRQVPMADGGEGLLDVFGGPNRHSEVTGPHGRPVSAGWRLEPNGTAIIESALASGLLLAGGAEQNDPVAATSAGTGELIAEAIRAGAHRILVGLGGSAMTDGGRGAVQALAGLGPDAAAPGRIAGPGTGRELLVCCDVTTTYVDAAAVFGPQKGADAAQVTQLGERLRDDAQWLLERFGVDVTAIPGSGAAGGLAGGLAALGGRLVSGFDQVAAERNLAAAIRGADLVVTGEGMLDRQSFQGKVVGGVAALARAAGVPVLAIAGVITDDAPRDITAVSMSERFGSVASMTTPLDCVRAIVTEQVT